MRQVITEKDAMEAVYDYIAEQLEGRFRLQFPDDRFQEVIANLISGLNDEEIRESEGHMKLTLATTTGDYFSALLVCSIDGCRKEKNHEFKREFIQLVLDARRLTAEWLKGQGVVPGQSAN